jgi:hypothetical protein
MALPHAITRLGSGDLDACLELAAGREWRPERRKWALLFEVGEVYGIRDPDGGLAGSVTLTRYGPDLAIVSMMLVAARFGGRGLGRRHDGLLEWAAERGVTPANDTSLMVGGGRDLPGARERLVLPVMQALG